MKKTQEWRAILHGFGFTSDDKRHMVTVELHHQLPQEVAPGWTAKITELDFPESRVLKILGAHQRFESEQDAMDAALMWLEAKFEPRSSRPRR